MIQLFNTKEIFMKKFFVMCAALFVLVACDKDEKPTAADAVSGDVVSDIDTVNVASDVSAVDVPSVETPDVVTATDASVGD
jgi:hypothetical protein